jgi:HUS1 checkpoint protein
LGGGWGQEVIFDDYQISSQNDDRIAFTVDLTLLSRALKSSVSMDGDKLLVKLVRKRPSLAEGRLPYLTFESKVCSHRSNHLC